MAIYSHAISVLDHICNKSTNGDDPAVKEGIFQEIIMIDELEGSYLALQGANREPILADFRHT